MIFVAIIGAIALLDLTLKWWVDKQDETKFPRPLPYTKEKIWLYHNHNAGFPFGFLKKHGEIVRLVPLVIISALAGILGYLIPRKNHLGEKVALTVLLGGAMSNLYDRFVRGHVIDYFSLRLGVLKKVVFNLGDICVFLGSGILLLLEAIKEIKAAVDRRRETL